MSARDPATDAAWSRTVAGFARLIDAITPWLLDLGNWIYGGLIALSLIILGSLLTVGPVDLPVKLATASFALALPLDVTGFVLLRLFADMARVRLPELSTRAFVEAGFQLEPRDELKITRARLQRVALRYCYGVLAIALFLMLLGLTAALWHMAWWIGVTFVVMVFVSQVVVVAAISALGPQGRWQSSVQEKQPKRD